MAASEPELGDTECCPGCRGTSAKKVACFPKFKAGTAEIVGWTHELKCLNPACGRTFFYFSDSSVPS